MIKHLYHIYGDIDDIYIEQNNAKMMKNYDPEQTLDFLIQNLEAQTYFSRARNKLVINESMV